MKYNKDDDLYYTTNTERLAYDINLLDETDKAYEVDTGNAYIVYGGAWQPII